MKFSSLTSCDQAVEKLAVPLRGLWSSGISSKQIRTGTGTPTPTAIVVGVGMIPTLVSFIVDMTPGRYACRCVAGLNVDDPAVEGAEQRH